MGSLLTTQALLAKNQILNYLIKKLQNVTLFDCTLFLY